MIESIVYQQSRRLRRFLSTDSVDTSFTAAASTTTKPSGVDVLDLSSGQAPGGIVPEWLILHPIATSGDNDTMDMRVTGWVAIQGSTGIVLWVPVALGQFTCTLSAAVGVAGAAVVNTERFADTIINHATISGAQGVTTGADGAAAVTKQGETIIHSPANDLVATIQMPLRGVELVQLKFDTTAGGTTAMNCLYRLL